LRDEPGTGRGARPAPGPPARRPAAVRARRSRLRHHRAHARHPAGVRAVGPVPRADEAARRHPRGGPVTIDDRSDVDAVRTLVARRTETTPEELARLRYRVLRADAPRPRRRAWLAPVAAAVV